MKPIDPRIEIVRCEASVHLERIQELFMPGAKITLLVRRPEAPDGSADFCLTDDDLEMAIEALRVRQGEGDDE